MKDTTIKQEWPQQHNNLFQHSIEEATVLLEKAQKTIAEIFLQQLAKQLAKNN
ncbi:MAG: hypothetical protein ACM3VS_09920 [Candidatus Dadabacteria bacterium]